MHRAGERSSWRRRRATLLPGLAGARIQRGRRSPAQVAVHAILLVLPQLASEIHLQSTQHHKHHFICVKLSRHQDGNMHGSMQV